MLIYQCARCSGSWETGSHGGGGGSGGGGDHRILLKSSAWRENNHLKGAHLIFPAIHQRYANRQDLIIFLNRTCYHGTSTAGWI